jgi:hypothetical protein
MSRFVGHYAPWLLAIVMGALIVMTLVPAVSSFVAWELLLLAQVAVLFLALSMFAHNRRLCGRCIASVPLDASQVAARYTTRFRIAHLFERKLYAGGYLGLVIGSAFLYTHPVGRYGWAAIVASLVYLLQAYVTHQRLQPWCPRCKNGGEEVVAAPTAPTPVSTSL